MPWMCPACRTNVQHRTELPQSNRVYRCPVCRLQMVFDSTAKKMKPLPPNGSNGNGNGNDDKTRKVA